MLSGQMLVSQMLVNGYQGGKSRLSARRQQSHAYLYLYLHLYLHLYSVPACIGTLKVAGVLHAKDADRAPVTLAGT